MKKFLPFVVQPKLDIVPIGNDEIGVIHLLKKGDVSPAENPVDLMEAGTKQAQAALIWERGVDRLAKQQGISNKDARIKLAGLQIKEAEEGTQVTVDDSESIYNYLQEDEVKQLLSLRENKAETAVKAASLFIRYRVAYPVKLATSAKAKVTTLTVEPIGFPIQAGQKIKFGSIKVEVKEFAEAGSEVLTIPPLSANLNEGSIGYLTDFETGKTMIGFPEWSDEDTASTLTEKLILAVYKFYMQEAGIDTGEEDEDEDEGKNLTLKPSSESPQENLQTGGECSLNSNTSDAGMNGSTQTTLEVSPVA